MVAKRDMFGNGSQATHRGGNPFFAQHIDLAALLHVHELNAQRIRKILHLSVEDETVPLLVDQLTNHLRIAWGAG